MKNALFLVEANNRLGMGHISRCMELARILKTKQMNSYFLINNNQYVKKLLSKNNFEYYLVSKKEKIVTKVRNISKNLKLDCIVIDLRKKNSNDLVKDLKTICKVIVIANYVSRSMFDSNLVIFPEINEQYNENLLKNQSKKLIGAKYAIINNSYDKPTKKDNNDILISMGGSDKRNLSVLLINEFRKYKTHFKIKIVIGGLFQNAKKIIKMTKNDNRFSIIQNESSLIPFMKNSKIGIFTLGITTYEALSVGLPSIIITHSKENDLAAKKMSKYDCIQYLGYYKSLNINTIPKISFSLLNDQKRRDELSKNAKKIVDGKGSLRIAREISKYIQD